MKLFRIMLPLVCCSLVGGQILAADERDPADNTVGGLPTILNPGHPPISRSIQASGGLADVDWFRVITRPYRSYEVVATNGTDQTFNWNLERLDSSGSSILQSWQGWGTAAGGAYFGVKQMRWATLGFASGDGEETVRVTGSASFTGPTLYTIEFRETTLFCPRFNNTASQVSVLIIQSSLDGTNSCNYAAHFFSEAGALLGSQSGVFNADSGGVFSPMAVISTLAVSGVAGQKGAARIAHTCGLGGVTAKLVALEPSTGFSFDTQCTTRSQ